MNNKLIYLVIVLLSLVACKKEEVYTPNLKGNITGTAFVFDEFGNFIIDNGGIKITAEGHKSYSALTDYYGRFEIENVPTGTYTIIAEKQGFGLLKKFGVKHLGGTPTCLTNNSFFLISKSSVRITSISISNAQVTADVNLQLDRTLYGDFLRLYYSDQPNVETNENYSCDSQYTVLTNGKLTGTWINYLNFPSGTKLYCKAFFQVTPALPIKQDVISGFWSYEDPENHNITIPNLGDASKEFSFIVP